MLCLESLVGVDSVDPAGVQGLEPTADPGPERAECPATHPGRHLLHRPAWLVAPEPDQEVLNQFPFKELHDPQCEEVKLIQITADQYSIISSHYVKSSIYFNNKTKTN